MKYINKHPNWFLNDNCVLNENNDSIIEMSYSWFSQSPEITVSGRKYKTSISGIMQGRFKMACNGIEYFASRTGIFRKFEVKGPDIVGSLYASSKLSLNFEYMDPFVHLKFKKVTWASRDYRIEESGTGNYPIMAVCLWFIHRVNSE